jgi:hypothetical protein
VLFFLHIYRGCCHWPSILFSCTLRSDSILGLLGFDFSQVALPRLLLLIAVVVGCGTVGAVVCNFRNCNHSCWSGGGLTGVALFGGGASFLDAASRFISSSARMTFCLVPLTLKIGSVFLAEM